MCLVQTCQVGADLYFVSFNFDGMIEEDTNQSKSRVMSGLDRAPGSPVNKRLQSVFRSGDDTEVCNKLAIDNLFE